MGACNYVSVYLVVEFVSGLMQVQSAPSAAGVRRAYIFLKKNRTTKFRAMWGEIKNEHLETLAFLYSHVKTVTHFYVMKSEFSKVIADGHRSP